MWYRVWVWPGSSDGAWQVHLLAAEWSVSAGPLRGEMRPVLPLFAAAWAADTLRATLNHGRPLRRSIFGSLVGRRASQDAFARVRRGLAVMGLASEAVVVVSEPPPSARAPAGLSDGTPAGFPVADGWSQVPTWLGGRILLEDEVVRAAKAQRMDPAQVLRQLEALATVAEVTEGSGGAGASVVAAAESEGWGLAAGLRLPAVWRLPAVAIDGAGAVCRRCGSRAVIPEVCGRCGAPACPRCTACAGMGVATGCRALYAVGDVGRPRPAERADGGPPAPEAGAVALDPALVAALSPAQAHAFHRLRACVQADAGRRAGCLVWAVTGAGKTEVAFGAAQQVLARHARVLFAAPRRQIAVDVARRARAAFGPHLALRLLVGPADPAARGRSAGRLEGDPDRWRPLQRPELVVATTHQALRFFQAFHLVVVDEVDAYPYAGSSMLEYAVARATHPEGMTVVMTATPGARWLARVERDGWSMVRIAARHHGYPLPVPEMWVDTSMERWRRRPQHPEEVPEFLREWLETRRRERAAGAGRAGVLVFVPTVALAEAVARALRPWQATFCHSRDPGRDGKVAAFARGEIGVLVSTTLLERGLTFDGVDVAVVHADDDRVFDTATLVQMAGRAGRTARHPTGRVLFAAATATPAMREAIATIQETNDYAGRMGLLQEWYNAGPGRGGDGKEAAAGSWREEKRR